MAGFKQIKIFTDTNIVHAAQAHLLVSNAVYKYVSEHKTIESVQLKWFLPSMVVEERRHQMLNAALTLSPKLTEVEKLLGHSLGISQEVMQDRIDSKISKTIKDLKINVCKLDISRVDWEDIIARSASRKAPFEYSSEKEKGFRDAIIANSFLQEVERSSKTPRICLLVFITGDNRVREYIEEKIVGSENVRILETLDELKSLLNAIASEVTEEFLKEIYQKAYNIFYDFDKKDGLYVKENVFSKMNDQHKNEINAVTDSFPNCFRKNIKTSLGKLTFIKKTGQTVIWSVKANIAFEIAKPSTLMDIKTTETLLSFPQEDQTIVKTGKSIFNIIWQHQVSTKGNLIKPKINKIDFVENVFDNDLDD